MLWGRCYEEQGVPPYWPWVQAIRGYVRARDPEQLRSEMGAGAADIAEIVSDLKTQLPELEHADLVGVPGPDEADGGPPHGARYITQDSDPYRLPSMEFQALIHEPEAFRRYLEGALP